MLYQLVIVEDESTTRHGLETYVPWEKLGFEVVGSFEDGLEAFQWIENNDCDVVLTDIMMSRMNGLEMAAQLNEIRPEIKVVILSGYSDFSYAKQAIQCRVVDYLLKPIDEDDLMRVFTKLKEQFDQEAEEQDIQQMKKSELMWTLQTSFLKNLLSGQISTENELNVYLRLLEIEEHVIQCPMIAFDLSLTIPDPVTGDHAADEEKFDSDTLGEKLREHFLSQSGEFLYFVMDIQDTRWGIIAISLTQTEIGRLKKHCREKILSFIQEWNTITQCEVSCEMTHAVQKVSDLLGGLTTISDEKEPIAVQEMEGEFYERMLLKYKVFIVELDWGNLDQVLTMIDDMMTELSGVSLESVRFILKNLYSMIAMEYGRRGMEVKEITGGKFDYNELYKAENIEEMAERMKEAFRLLLEGLQEIRTSYNSDIVGRIVQYVEKNIAGDLSSEVIAKKHRLHPAYMSRIFKQKTGENLSDYILRIRMEKGVQLLKTGEYKVLEISEMVGFKYAGYFSTMFKKYTGYSPLEYCEKVLS
ncbi:MAG: response regulator [Lachnospiraceae bacterium]|nr:response regulator [Lachnospiraceae bacterium]